MKPRRRWLRRLLLLVALLAVAALAIRWLLQPERLGALVIDQLAGASGLQITVAAPARLGFWPGLHLELDGLEASAAGDTPLLRVQRAELFMPLATLWQPLSISDITLQSPELDLAALARWQASAQTAGPPAPLTVPAITRLQLRDGVLRDGEPILDGLQLQLDGLARGEVLTLRAEAMLAAEKPEQAISLALELDGVWASDGDGLRLDPLQLRLGAKDQPATLDLAGTLWWSPPQRLDLGLAGTLGHVPANWPQAALLASLAGAQLNIAHSGPANLSGATTLDVQGPTYTGKARLQLPALLDWLAAGDWNRPAPLELQVQAERIEQDGVVIEGLHIEHGIEDDDDAD